MKRTAISSKGLRGLCVVGFVLALFVLPGSAPRALAQQAGQGKYLTEASLLLIKLVDQSNGQGYRLADNGFSIGGGWLTQGQNNWVSIFTLDLQAGRDYRFIGAGDADALDLDLQVLNNSNQIVAQDTGTEHDAVVNYRPSVSGRYLIRMRLYASKNNLPCACMSVVMSR